MYVVVIEKISKNGGGAENRTRVRKYLAVGTTCVADEFI